LSLAEKVSGAGMYGSDESLQKEAIDTSRNFSFVMGASLGAMVIGMIIGGVSLVSNGLYLLVGSRKERLLIEFSKRLSREG
jgi:hypothetical protein